MSDTSQGAGWWMASDGKWYPPVIQDPTQSAPPPPGGQSPPPGGSSRSVPLWSVLVIGAVAVAALAVAVFALSGDDGSDQASPTTTAPIVETAAPDQTTTSAPDDTTTTTASTTTTTASTTPASTMPAREGAGSRDDPHPLGVTLVHEDRADITIESVDLDADDEWVADHIYNEPPPDDLRYIFVRATYTNRSGGPMLGAPFNIWAIGSRNELYDEHCKGRVPDTLMGERIEPGESGTGNFCILVPVAEIDDGSLLLEVSPLIYSDDTQYVMTR